MTTIDLTAIVLNKKKIFYLKFYFLLFVVNTEILVFNKDFFPIFVQIII